MGKDTERTARAQRGLNLADRDGGRIWRIAPHTWEVPSCTGTGTYVVRTDRGRCDCPDFERHGDHIACKHQVAVEIVASRRRKARAA